MWLPVASDSCAVTRAEAGKGETLELNKTRSLCVNLPSHLTPGQEELTWGKKAWRLPFLTQPQRLQVPLLRTALPSLLP